MKNNILKKVIKSQSSNLSCCPRRQVDLVKVDKIQSKDRNASSLVQLETNTSPVLVMGEKIISLILTEQ